MKNIVLIVLVCAMLSACGTITRGRNEDVVIKVTPPDANVTTSLGLSCSTSPCTLNVERRQKFTVTASKQGYQTKTVAVGTKVSGKGAASMVGNAVFGGVIGVGVDAATGASLDHTPNPVVIDLVPVGQAPRRPKPSDGGTRRTPVS